MTTLELLLILRKTLLYVLISHYLCELSLNYTFYLQVKLQDCNWVVLELEWNLHSVEYCEPCYGFKAQIRPTLRWMSCAACKAALGKKFTFLPYLSGRTWWFRIVIISCVFSTKLTSSSRTYNTLKFLCVRNAVLANGYISLVSPLSWQVEPFFSTILYWIAKLSVLITWFHPYID